MRPHLPGKRQQPIKVEKCAFCGKKRKVKGRYGSRPACRRCISKISRGELDGVPDGV